MSEDSAADRATAAGEPACAGTSESEEEEAEEEGEAGMDGDWDDGVVDGVGACAEAAWSGEGSQDGSPPAAESSSVSAGAKVASI
jgi:hypothetical protein